MPQRIDDQFAEEILQMHDDFGVIGRDRVKVVAILWVVLYQLVYAARILSRVYIGSTDSIITDSFVYLNVVFVLQSTEIVIYVAYIYDHEHAYILGVEKRYEERRCCPPKLTSHTVSCYVPGLVQGIRFDDGSTAALIDAIATSRSSVF